MHDETVAIHGGYTPDTTRAVAVPIYQTIAHDFADAAHAGAVFDLEVPGFHYNRLNNPTNDVLERRLANARRRGGSRRPQLGRRGRQLLDLEPRHDERQHRHRATALRIHLHPLRPCASEARHRGPLCRRRPT